MEKTDKMPLWVFLAFSSIETRKAALILIYSCVVFSIYCIPWVLLLPAQEWLGSIFLIDDWSWLAMMVPMTLWYVLSLRWVDQKGDWKSAPNSED
jgi:hypothetical protein